MSQPVSVNNVISIDNYHIFRWNQICRACLCEDITFQPLFNNDCSNIRLAEMMTFCTSLQVSTDDMFPQQLCTEYVEQLSTAYYFKVKCQSSAEKLQKRKIKPEKKVPCTDIQMQENICNDSLYETNVITANVEVVLDETEQNIDINKMPSTTCKIEQEHCDSEQDTSAVLKLRKRSVRKTIQKQGENNIEPEKQNETSILNTESNEEDVGTFMGRHRKREKKHLCHECGLSFDCPKTLLSHQSSMTHQRKQPGKTIKTCLKCRLHFDDPAEYLKHRRSHETSVCPDCGKVCKSGGSYHDHMLSHSNLRPHACAECGKMYKTNRALKIHQRKHTGERPFSCEMCDDKFMTWHSMKYHIQADHNNERNYVCHICSNAFLTSTLLNRHIKIHTGEKPYPCTECDMKFEEKTALTDHLIRHAGEKKYPCKLCSKLFITPFSLRQHNRRVHKKGERNYLCTICERGFFEARGLKRHMRYHPEILETVNSVSNE